jgi:small GTP-binding protein
MNMKKSRGSSDTKVILVGDASVGKTSLLLQFTVSACSDSPDSTIGAEFVAKPVGTSHGPVNLHMWDTAGQERYRSLIPLYSRNASAVVLVVDVSNKISFESIESWHAMLKEKCPPSAKIYVVANKIDLTPEFPVDELEKWAHGHRFPFFKSCAMWHETVDPIFKQVAEDAGMVEVATTRPQRIPLLPGPPSGGDDACC